MTACLYNTNANWMEFLRGHGIRNNVNFWRQDQRVLHLPPGSALYFKEHGAARVAGRGFFRECLNLSAGEVWTRFGRGNGYPTKEALYAAMPEVLKLEVVTDDTAVGCVVLDGLDWLDVPVTLPAGFFQQGIMGPKYFEDQEVAFIAAAFPEESVAGAALSPVVLFEADATAGGEYDDWDDLTGEQYHYPNKYRNLVVEGRRFIYYRGVRRQGGRRGPAEYFGHGTIGAVRRDPATAAEQRAAHRAWFCGIEDYVEFANPVASARAGGGYYENITRPRDWQNAVREISEEIYASILTDAGLTPRPVLPAARIAVVQPADLGPVMLRESEDLLRPRAARNAVRPGGVVLAHSVRRSRRAAAIGRRAETLVKQHLERRFGNVRWLSEEGEVPGYDLEYHVDGTVHAVEVKGTTGSVFPAIELTINEWRAAEQLRDRFWLYLVTNCEGREPCLQIVHDPYSLLLQNRAVVSPLLVRFELRADVPVLQHQ